MKKLTKFFKSGTRFAGDKKGVAALEFALIAPIIITMALGAAELYFRFLAYDQFNRYSFQMGDYISRAPELTTNDVKDLYKHRGKILTDVPSDDLEIYVASYGFNKDGEAKLLWQREYGADEASQPTPDLTGLGVPGETVIYTRTKLPYTLPISIMTSMIESEYERETFYRPRDTRAIAMDGEIAETNKDWDSGIN